MEAIGGMGTVHGSEGFNIGSPKAVTVRCVVVAFGKVVVGADMASAMTLVLWGFKGRLIPTGFSHHGLSIVVGSSAI